MKLNCKDELAELLKQRGYNLVLLPRENIQPLQILKRNNKGVWARLKDVFTTPLLDDTHAPLQELFIADSQPLPTPKDGDVTNDVKGKRSSEMSIEAAAELMLNFLALPDEEKTDAQKLKLQVALQSAKAVSFAWGDETIETSVSLSQLDSFISDSELRDKVGNSFREWIENEQIYIITSVLKATSFTMKGSKDNSASASINVPKIKEILTGKISGSMDIFEGSGLKYKGDKALVFGFKAVRLKVEEKNGKTIYKIKIEDGLAVKGEEDIKVETLQLEEGENFLELE